MWDEKKLILNNFRSEIFASKTVWSPTKIFGLKIILAQKRFLAKEKIWVVKKNCHKKELWVQGKFLSKNFGEEKFSPGQMMQGKMSLRQL